MDRSARNPASLPGVYSNPLLSPTEQDVYATGHLFRGIAATEGHNTVNRNPKWTIASAAQDMGQLLQLAFIELRHST
jgi:hypothetical protein